MTCKQAEQIANLINARNRLQTALMTEEVFKNQKHYLFRTSVVGDVIACVKLKKLSWYQCEVSHLAVAEPHTRQGYANSLLEQAVNFANDKGARLVQCTIRADNQAIRELLTSNGFTYVHHFKNRATGNMINVYKRIL